MKILVINGSPKGKFSITIQSVEYLQKHFPSDHFEILNIGQQIKKYEDPQLILATIKKIHEVDLLLFAYPVYTFLAPYQLQRFIELLKENLKDECFNRIMSTQISTSKHFYDITAHRYIEENCNDLGFNVIKGFSADMDDLLSDKGRKELIGFWKYVKFTATQGIFEAHKKTLLQEKKIYTQRIEAIEKSNKYKTVIVTNCEKNDSNLMNMINDFCKAYPFNTRIINILDFKFDGGCLGCFNCAINGTCIYKDGFDNFLRNEIQTADSIVYAATIKDHSFGASFKRYDDRQFCNGHRSLTMGMPIAFIISGEYSKESNVRNLIEAKNEVEHTFLSGVINDENKNEEQIEKNIKATANTMAYALQNKLILPQNFYGVGGRKIFRDLIYVMGGLMKEDHKFYKKNNFYDFPQKQKAMKFMARTLGLVMSIPTLKKASSGKMNQFMITKYKQVINQK